MNWLGDQLHDLWRRLAGQGGGVTLSPAQQERLAAWQARPPADLSRPHGETRYVIVDVEASGLNMARDKLISIGAVTVNGGVIDFNDAFEVVLRQESVSSVDNILIHGISGEEQREGVAPEEALLAFLEYVGKDPLVAYHAMFDQNMIGRALKEFLGHTFRQPWIDLAWVMPFLFSRVQSRSVPLDEWLTHFAITNFRRHNAVADCLATAQLLQVALAQAEVVDVLTPARLAQCEEVQRVRLRSL